MANTIITSKMTQILSLEMAKLAGFVKIGAKDYFSDQINGKMRAGQTYTFVLPDAGNVVQGLVASPRDIEEKKVELTIKNWDNSVKTDVLEGVTDIKWEEEIAKSYAKKLIQALEADAVADALKKATTCFVGQGFAPLANAGAHIQSITNEDVYGFVDPQMQATLASNGQSFVPTGSPSDLYAKGHLGVFQGVDYTAERFIKPMKIAQGLVDAVSAAKATQLNAAGDELTITGVVGTATLPEGCPIFVEGLFAADTVGDETNVPFAFFPVSAHSLTAGSNTIKVTPVVTADIGARDVVGDMTAANNGGVSVPESGSYYRGIIRADGAYCYTPVNTLDFRLSDKMTQGDTDGIKCFVNSFTDGISAVNTTRFDAPSMYGTVEKRAVSVVLWKK